MNSENRKLKLSDIDWLRMFIWSLSVSAIATFSGAVVDGMADLLHSLATFFVAFIVSISGELKKITEKRGGEDVGVMSGGENVGVIPKVEGGLHTLKKKLKRKGTTIFAIPFLD